MPALRKKLRRAPSRADSSDSDDNSVESNPEMGIVEVDFEVKVPVPDDKQGIKNLLQQLFLKAHVNLAELADIIIEQESVSGVIKEGVESEDEDYENDAMEGLNDTDVSFGVFSVINVTEKKDKECIKQIYSYLLNHCKNAVTNSQYEQIQDILNDSTKQVGLIINERLVNIPCKISVPLFQGLRSDMNKARENNEAFHFSYYLLICKTATFTTTSHEENVIYLNPEEEIIEEEAEFAFEFSVQAEHESGLSEKWSDDDSEGIPKRKVLLIPANKFDAICEKLSAELN